LALFFPLASYAQETFFYQGWEGAPGENGLYGFEQYNNQTWSQQNVWARKGYVGVNAGGAQKFRLLNPGPQCGDGILDSCLVANGANFMGQNGAHIITGAMVERAGTWDSTFVRNHRHTGYHTGPYCQTPFGCAGQTAESRVGLYSPKLLSNNAYASVRVEFWMRVNGELNKDYGLLRYSVKPEAPAGPLPDAAPLSSADEYWTTAVFGSNDVGTLADPLISLGGDTTRYITLVPAQSTVPGQLQGIVAPSNVQNAVKGDPLWVKVSYLLPRECAGDTNLRIGFWWVNDNNGKGAFPALMVDEIKLVGYRFATRPLAEAVYCPGMAIDVPFEIDAKFLQDSIVNVPNADTMFYAVLSDSAGNFINADTIGQISLSQLTQNGDLAWGTIHGLIPTGITQIAIGGYRVRVVAPHSGFRATLSPTVVSIFPPPVVSIWPKDTKLCEGASVKLTATQGADYYRWFKDGVQVALLTDDSTYTTSDPGVYSVEAQYLKCISLSTENATVELLPRPTVSLAIPDSMRSVCYLKNIAQLSGGAPDGGRYFWYYEGDTTFGAGFNSVLAGIGKHVIGYEYADPQTGCKGYAFDTIKVLNAPYATIIPNADTLQVCDGKPLTLSLSATASAYLWSNGETSQEISVTEGGSYYADLVNDEGCTYRTKTVVVVRIPAVLAAPTLDPTLAVGATSVKGTAVYIPGYPVRVLVYVNDKVVGTTTVQPNGSWSMTLPAPLGGGDKVYVKARTDSNCDGVVNDADALSPASNLVTIGGEEPTTGFSPNGDNKNDVWVIIPGLPQRFPNAQLTVYNRWGNEVFNQEGYDNAWDGDDLPDGTYYFVLDLKDGSKKKSGYVTILR